MLVAIRERRAVSPAADELLDRMLGRAYWDGEALCAVPSDVHAISKQGAVDASRSEVLLVSAPSGPYVLCVITKNQKDQSWEDGNAGFRLLRRASASAWRHMEPTRPHDAPIEGPRWP
jgi:beta-lactamase class A